MRSNKIFLIFIIIFLFAINVFTLSRFKELKRQFINVKSQRKEILRNNLLNAYKINLKEGIMNNGLLLVDIKIKDSLSRITQLNKVFNTGQKQILVYRFSKKHCENCVVSAMQVLQKWVGSIAAKNILFLGNYQNNRIFYKTIKEYGISYVKVFNTGSFNIPAEELNYPYFFILNKNMQISDIFFPDKKLTLITNEYLGTVKRKFSNQ